MKQLAEVITILCISIFAFSGVVSANSYDYSSIYDKIDNQYSSLYLEDDDFYNEASEKDPLELLNRIVFSFNMSMDTAFIEPYTNMYMHAVPEYGRQRVNSFFSNLGTPISFANDVIQINFQSAMTDFWRFVINSTFGCLGIFDVATELNLPAQNNSFGKTLAKLKIKSGPYIVLPVLGPSTLTNAVGTLTDSYADYKSFPQLRDFKKDVRILKLINVRTKSFAVLNDIKYKTLDPYVAMRSMYLQNKAYEAEEF